MTNHKAKTSLYGKFDDVTDALLAPVTKQSKTGKLKKAAQPHNRTTAQPHNRTTAQPQLSLKTFIDLFCGVGGFHLAAAAHGLK